MARKRRPQYVYEVERQMNNLTWISDAFFKTENEADQRLEQLELTCRNKSFVDRPFRILKHEMKKIEDFEN